jgi:carbon storage regulator
MLVLTRRHGESVRIGPDIRITIVASTGGQVRIAIDAPKEVGIFREEVFQRVAAANLEAAGASKTMVSGLRKNWQASAGPVGGERND